MSTPSLESHRLFHAPLAMRAREIVLYVMVGAMAYGAVMGTYGLGRAREEQILFSSLKVPLLLLGTFAMALPSFLVINTLCGLRQDLRLAVRAHLQAQSALTAVLASLAPFTLVWYASVRSYPLAVLFNALMFAVATLAGQVVLRRLYRPLITRNPRHRTMMRLWLALYAFVGIQMGWVLRPFVGEPASQVRFFRAGAWGNAYLELWNIVQSVWR